MTEADMVEAIMSQGKNAGVFAGVRYYLREADEGCEWLRLVFPMNGDVVDAGHEGSFTQAVLESLFSETTNNDACDVKVRVRSAHFDTHPDIPRFVKEDNFGMWVVVDAEILDYLS